MSDIDTPAITRSFSRTDFNRSIINVALVAAVAACNWFMLPAIQSLIIPNAAGGANGPWVLRPILAFHFGAMAVMTSVTVPLLTISLRRNWKREDAAIGSRYDPFAGSRLKRADFYFKGILLLIIYGAFLIFYLLSWETIGPDGIDQHLPWTTLHHSFQDIASLELVPDGERSDSIGENGPWYSIKLRSGRSITFSPDNEGVKQDELAAMTAFVAQRCELGWTRRTDSHKRGPAPGHRDLTKSKT